MASVLGDLMPASGFSRPQVRFYLLWVLGIKLGSSGLCSKRLICQALSQPSPHTLLRIFTYMGQLVAHTVDPTTREVAHL